MNKTERLQMIIMYLKQKGKLTASELSDYLEVSKRTIYRDIDALSQMNVPIASNDGINGGYEIDESYFMPTVRLSEREALILLLLLKVSKQLNMPELKESIHSLELKIQNTYQDSAQRYKNILKYVSFEVRSIFPDTYLNNVFETILESFDKQVKLRIKYYSPLKNKSVERTIDPLNLFFSEGGWYLEAFCHSRNENRTFRLDRIESIRLMPDKKDDVIEKQYYELLHSKPAHVIEFDIDRNLYNLIKYDSPMKDARILSEGSSMLRIQVGANRFVYFESLAVRNSDQITILKPEALIKDLHNKLLRAIEKY